MNRESIEEGNASTRTKTLAREIIFPDDSTVCVIGVIDILQEWNFHKKLERFFKVYIRHLDREGISCIEPYKYATRFNLRVDKIIDVSV